MKASQFSLHKERNFDSKRYIWTVKKMSFNEKYIAKMFNLKKFLVSACIFKLVCFCESCGKPGICFTQSVFAEKSLNRLVLVSLIFTFLFFLIKMHEIDTAAEMYLEPFPTYMFELYLQK